jgi:NDP-hexose 4-ketoreductase
MMTLSSFWQRHLAPLRMRGDVLVFPGSVSSACSDNEAYAREEVGLRHAIDQSAMQGRQLVYFSSCGAVYGAHREDVREDQACLPVNHYGMHKLKMERLIQDARIDYLILRLSTPVGAAQPTCQLVASLWKQICAGEVRVWRGAHRDLIDVREIVRLTSRLLERGVNREVVNLASGHAVAVERLADEIEELCGGRAKRIFSERPDRHSVSVEKLFRLCGAALLPPLPMNGWQNALRYHYGPTLPEAVAEREPAWTRMEAALPSA